MEKFLKYLKKKILRNKASLPKQDSFKPDALEPESLKSDSFEPEPFKSDSFEPEPEPQSFKSESLKSKSNSNSNSLKSKSPKKHKIPLPKLFYFHNCNASKRCARWLGPLDGNDRIGCGLNILRFLNLMDDNNARKYLKEAEENDGMGTPFSIIEYWINEKINDPGRYTKIVYEKKKDISSREKLSLFFHNLNIEMEDNSCMIALFNRDPDIEDKLNSTAGHYVLFSKKDGILQIYEHLNSNYENCNVINYNDKLSENFLKTYKGFESVSILFIKYLIYDEEKYLNQQGGDKISGNILNDLINSIEENTECKSGSNISSTVRFTTRKKSKLKNIIPNILRRVTRKNRN